MSIGSMWLDEFGESWEVISGELNPIKVLNKDAQTHMRAWFPEGDYGYVWIAEYEVMPAEGLSGKTRYLCKSIATGHRTIFSARWFEIGEEDAQA